MGIIECILWGILIVTFIMVWGLGYMLPINRALV